MISSSFQKALKNYDLLVDTSCNWISRYYKKTLRFSNVDIHKIQAFSQYYFFSHLLEKLPMKDIWTNYPEVGSDKRETLFKILIRTIDVTRELFAPKVAVKNLGKRFDLIFVASGRHFDDLFELVKYLNKRYKILIVGKLSKQAQSNLKNEKIEFVHILGGRRSLGPLKRLGLILKYSLLNWDLKSKNILFRDNLWKSRLLYLRLVQFPEIESLIITDQKLINSTEPKIILTTTSNDLFGAAFTLTAQANGIKVAEIQHGITVWKEVESVFYTSDFYLVWGNISKTMHSKKAIVVGSPYFKKSQINSNTTYGLKKRYRVLVLWTPPFGLMSIFRNVATEKVFLHLLTGLEKLPTDWEITIRSHPSYPIEDLMINETLPTNIHIDKEKSVWESINLHDIIITQETTAGLIAMFQKKPLLYFDSSHLFEKYSSPYVRYKCALNIPIKDLSNLNNYVSKLLNNPKLIKAQFEEQRKFIINYCRYLGKDSYEEIANFLNHAITR